MFQGVFTALITPFQGNGSIDKAAIRRIVEDQIAGGVAGLVPMGTTGESPTVTHDENIEAIRLVVEAVNGRVPVIAGTGSNSTSEAIDMTRRAKAIGASASLQVTPYYNKPMQEGLYRHFTAIADAVDLPMIVYNIPGRTSRNIETPTLRRMAEHPNIVAVKEASGSIPQMMDVLEQLPSDFDVLSGDDNLTFPLIMLGGRGVISVASNLVPGRVSKMVDAALKGEIAEARKMHYELLPLCRAAFIETNPGPIKYMMHKAGYCEEAYRLPLSPLSEEAKAAVDKVLASYGII